MPTKKMGKKTKVGKQRKDKYYKLAKETGYRSRAAFKLVQLNRKFEFLQRSQIVVDLCAAPGGWLQVAAEYTPTSTLIIGVDLVSIKPLKGVITLQDDITTENCRQSIKKELKTWEADCVLHDGAPNVGMNWIQDAFSQAQLVLSAMRLATEILRKGGWFITKVFRSKDYTALLAVFKELFNKVHATKPQASRNESAEIFVVCQGFKKPAKISPQLLEVKHVFRELHMDTVKPKLNVLHPEKRKKGAEGYIDGNYSVYGPLSAIQFVQSDNFLELLGKTNEILLDSKDLAEHQETTPEIRACFKDIQVLGRKELRDVLNWRKKVRKHMISLEREQQKESREKELTDPDMDKGDTMEFDEDLQMDQAIADAASEEKSQAKRKKKQLQKEKKLRRDKINLEMVIPGDRPDAPEREEELFDLVRLEKTKQAPKERRANVVFLEDETISNISSRWELQKRKADVELSSDDEEIPDMEDSDIPDDVIHGNLVAKEPETTEDSRTALWFQQETFAGLETEEDEDAEIEKMMQLARSKKAPTVKDESAETASQFNVEKRPQAEGHVEDAPKSKRKRVKLDAEALALGSMMIHSSKAKRDIVEFAYSRFTNNDTNLPDWFAQDEKKHYRKPLPVSQELVKEYKSRLTDINSKTIKKVSEAKARKKKRALRKMEKARKKAESVIDNPELTEKEKTSEMRRIYKKAGIKKERTKVTYVVAKKGVGKKVKRPANVKGRFKVVDPRMKKDEMKQKTRAKNAKMKGKREKGKRRR